MANGGSNITPQQTYALMKGGWPALQQTMTPQAGPQSQVLGGVNYGSGQATAPQQNGFSSFMNTLNQIQGAQGAYSRPAGGFQPQIGIPQAGAAPSNIPGLGSPLPPPAPTPAPAPVVGQGSTNGLPANFQFAAQPSPLKGISK